MDVKFAFLNGPLDKEVHLDQPPSFEVKRKKHMVYRLYKILYGLKQHQEPGTGELMFSSSVMVLKDVQLGMVCM